MIDIGLLILSLAGFGVLLTLLWVYAHIPEDY